MDAQYCCSPRPIHTVYRVHVEDWDHAGVMIAFGGTVLVR